jgi:hypothetical protein
MPDVFLKRHFSPVGNPPALLGDLGSLTFRAVDKKVPECEPPRTHSETIHEAKPKSQSVGVQISHCFHS